MVEQLSGSRFQLHRPFHVMTFWTFANTKLASLQDEVACIGCKQCVWIAQGTFRIEPAHGRSRVFAQWVDTEDDIQVRHVSGSR